MAPIGIHSTPQELLELARLGQKLKPKERQAVISWLEVSGEIEKYGEHQLSQILQCKPATIKGYIHKARRTQAQAITAEDAMNYMVSFLRSTDVMIKECKKMVMDPKIAGSGIHPVYMRLLKELESEKIEKLQSIGVIPKELGRMTAVEEHWEATVSEKGVTAVREAGDDDEQPA